MAYNDPHMISDEALNVMFSDELARNSMCADEDGLESFNRAQEKGGDRIKRVLLAHKKTMYRETPEYNKAVLDERMKNKPKPTPRPMAGYGSNAYRTWSR